MAFRSYKTVISAYCETALKVKYSRDDQTAQMLDLIQRVSDDKLRLCLFRVYRGT